jgi:hypothetical protein
MRIARYQAHNVKRIVEIDWDMEGEHLFLVGGTNASGKTAGLHGLLMALAGRRDFKFPERPLRDGEDSGLAEIWLAPDEGDEAPKLKVSLSLKRSAKGIVSDTVTITDMEGTKLPQPRQILRELYSTAGFDPLAFEGMPQKKQAEVLSRLVGIDFVEWERDIQAVFEDRGAANKDLSLASTAWEVAPSHPDAPEKEVSVAELLDQRDKATTHNQEAAALEEEAIDAEQVVSDHNWSIQEMEQKLKACRERQEQCKAAAQEARAKAAAVKLMDIEAIDSQIQQVSSINDQVKGNLRKAELKASMLGAKEKVDRLTKSLESRRSAFQAAIEQAPWPVPGLSVVDGLVMFEDMPFSDRSRAERTEISFRICAALNPTLKVLICEHGSDLDMERLEALDRMLKETGFQAIVELVTRTQQDEDLCSVVMSEGRVKP